MLRVIEELRPTWAVGENVTGIIGVELDRVLADLEGADYSCRAFVFPAAAVGAPHRRERVAIVAHTNCQRYPQSGADRKKWGGAPWTPSDGALQAGMAWEAEPGIQPVADGVPQRLDQLKAIGNAVVPAQFYPIFKAIADIERGKEGEP